MRRVVSYRANKILYNFLRSNQLQGTIVLPANICPDVVETLQYAGYVLQYVDIDSRTLVMDWKQAMQYVDEACAILCVHTYGIEDDFTEIFDSFKALNPNIAIIDDQCLCIPDLSLQESSADLILYSTGGKKQIDLGKGGIGYVSSQWRYEDIEIHDNAPLINEEWFFDESAVIRRIDAIIKHKERINKIYRNNLPQNIQLPEKYQHWRFNILVPNKEIILKAIFDAGLFASGHYASMSRECLIATNLHQYVINLFNDFYFTESQAEQVCEIINQYV